MPDDCRTEKSPPAVGTAKHTKEDVMPVLNTIDIILIIAVAAVVTAAVIFIIRRKKRGGCSCGCAGCAMSGLCEKEKKENQ